MFVSQGSKMILFLVYFCWFRNFKCIYIVIFTSCANWKKRRIFSSAVICDEQLKWPFYCQGSVVSNDCMKLNSCSFVSSYVIANQFGIVVFKCCAPPHTVFRFSSSTEQSSSRLMRRHRRRRRKPKASNMDRVRGHDEDETRDWKSASHIPSLVISFSPFFLLWCPVVLIQQHHRLHHVPEHHHCHPQHG